MLSLHSDREPRGHFATKAYYFQEYIHETKFGGAFADTAASVRLIRRGEEVTAYFPETFANSTTAATIEMDDELPERFRPGADQVQVITILDNGTNAVGSVLVEADGSVTIYDGQLSGNFTGGGSSTGFNAFTMRWNIRP